MKNNVNRKRERLRLKRIIIFACSFIFLYALAATAIAPKQYTLKEGDIPRVDIKAPREIIDESATKTKEIAAVEKVGKQYTLKSDVETNAQNDIKLLFEKLKSINSPQNSDTVMSETEKISQLKKLNIMSGMEVSITDEEYKSLLSISSGDLDKIQGSIFDIINSAYEKNIEENDEEYLNQVRAASADRISEFEADQNVILTLQKIVSAEINPNFFYDEAKTNEKIEEAKKSVSKVMIKQNQIIVKEGEPVTAEQIQILSELGMLNDKNSKTYVYVYFTLAILLFIIMYLQFSFIKHNYIKIFADTKKIILINVINILSVVFARVLELVSPLLMPFACAPILLSLLVNYRISLVVSCYNVIIISAINGFDIQLLIIGMINAILGSILLKKMKQRNELIYTTGYIAVISSILGITTGILISSDLKDILIRSGITFIAGILSGVSAMGILPFLESTFNEITILKLLELSNPNTPLLKRLIMEAPGTYHHSVMVANLAELAAEEVGADAALARVGAYYHDIGKLQRPYFFGENLMGMESPHDSIQPNMSASIIISHVKDGVELAKKNKLPKSIIDIIAQHHGNSLVKYFYYTMKNNSPEGTEIDEKDYRYEGPIPDSKEAAVIMLADSTEAAVRSIKEHTKEKIDKMINDIINDKLSSGQLNNCDLTLKDIEKIKKCFITSMNGLYHERIEYPKEKK